MMESMWRLFKKLEIGWNMTELYIPVMGIYQKDSITYHRDRCLSMFIAVLSLVARKWNLPRYPSTDE